MSARELFFKTGTTLASFKASGKTPSISEEFIKCEIAWLKPVLHSLVFMVAIFVPEVDFILSSPIISVVFV